MTEPTSSDNKQPASSKGWQGAALQGLDPNSTRLPQTATEYYLLGHLAHLYGEGVAPGLAKTLLQMVDEHRAAGDWAPARQADAMDAGDILLITYGDTLVSEGRKPLAVLKAFADEYLAEFFSGIHILPFFPYSSDDGFAVVDYTTVREDLGDWSDVRAVAEKFDLMFDLVINHCSREHIWFADFVSGRSPGCDYFLQLPADSDLSAVVRPRNTPLLSQVQTYAGPRHVWTTFSEDQVDLNFENPDVLCRFVDILLAYVGHGANIIRLDAIAFLWKRPGSNCMSLPETHIVVKVLRLLLDYSNVDVRLLTETNVPHAENVSYFGQQDQAHMVYQFSLAPLLLYSYLFNDGTHLQGWARSLQPPPEGCAYLNFIASHDGIGLRPLEGLVPADDIEALIQTVHERGGFVSMRTATDGSQKPYEMNISLFSAFGGAAESVPAYVAAHQLLLAFQGVPALYLRALLGSPNDLQAVERTGRTRSINRGHLQLVALSRELEDETSVAASVYDALTRSLRLRKNQPAFSPEGAQEVLPCKPAMFAMLRSCEQQQILVLASFVPVAQQVALDAFINTDGLPVRQVVDVLTGTLHDVTSELFMAPFQVMWLDLTGAAAAN